MSDLGFDNLFREWVSGGMSSSITAKQGTGFTALLVYRKRQTYTFFSYMLFVGYVVPCLRSES